MHILQTLLPSAAKLRRLYFHRHLSVHSGRSASVHAGIPPPGPDTPLWAQTPPGADPPGETATAADGTHPTGMHSCLAEPLEMNVPNEINLL